MDVGYGIAVDGTGNAYVTGQTNGNFPTTAGAYQTAYGGGTTDAFVAKLNPAGGGANDLVYSTYLGGSGDDTGYGIAVDSSGNAYVTGFADGGFPTTPSAYQTAYGGGTSDAFVAELNSAGNSLAYSTYLGGSGNDQGYAIAVDSAGNAYVTGYAGGGFPTTAGAYQTVYGGNDDAFVTKLNASGSALVYSTYLGGSGYDQGCAIALDGTGPAYVTGFSSSSDFPTTSGAYQTVLGGGNDAFVAKFALVVPTPTPTATPTPSSTSTPTPSITPTPTSTPLPSCDEFYVSGNKFTPSNSPISIYVSYCKYPGNYSLRIYNSAGEHIRTLDEGHLEAPIAVSYQWDGKNKYGDPCASGVYLLYLTEPYNRKIKRILLLK